jgi:hypothetical protein
LWSKQAHVRVVVKAALKGDTKNSGDMHREEGAKIIVEQNENGYVRGHRTFGLASYGNENGEAVVPEHVQPSRGTNHI